VIKLRKPWLIRPAGTFGAAAIRALNSTVRVRIASAGTEIHPPPPPPEGERFVYVLWHEGIIAATEYREPLTVLTSHHADGALMTRIVKHMGIKVIRGSTTRGGSGALLGLIRRTARTHIALTPDGPIGPRRRLKPGAVALASMTGLRIVPFGVGCSSAWRAGSWDRMLVPKPYSTTCFVTGPAFVVPPNLDRAGLLRYCRKTEAALTAVTVAAERWAAGGARPVPAEPMLAAA
jgi:lysophospholipid acyltransferase (LPLAT)-like uncharacterized protein